MGCAASSIDKEERVQICKDRKKLMKQLLGVRGEFANAVLAYLRSLKNIGVTLRQVTDSELSELENVPFSSGLVHSPPSPLPPSPPPPPPFSPDHRKLEGICNAKEAQEEIIEIGDDSNCTPPPPPIASSSWDLLDLFEKSSLQQDLESSTDDEDKWAETRSQFGDEDNEHMRTNVAPCAHADNLLKSNGVDDESSMVSRRKKDSVDMTMVVWKSKKTLPVIVKELDDYFLKASAAGKEIAVIVDMGARNTSANHDSKDNKAKGNNSGRLFSSLSCNWSSRSHHFTRDDLDVGSNFEPCKPGAHCITLGKLYAEEQILCKAIREEEATKLEHHRKSLLLQRQEDENIDSNKIEKTRATVENLQSDRARLQELVQNTCSSILVVINEELHPQLIALLSGLIHMWRTMYECHRYQIKISKQVSFLANHHSTEPTTECHREATVQLENEVNFWYNSFSRLIKCQREYVNVLFRWIQLSDCLIGHENQSHFPSTVRTLCEKWELALDRLPEKVASEAIKNFLLVVQSIIQQQQEEFQLKKKSDKLERRLHKELNSLTEMEKKLKESLTQGDMESRLSPKHPLTLKRAKADALKKRFENEKAKYVSCVEVSRGMTLKNLHSCLPNVFQSLAGFSGACSQAFEAVLSYAVQMPQVDEPPVEC